MTSALDPEQRSRLLAAKLGALVEGGGAPGRTPDAEARPVPFGGGAGLVAGTTAWILLEAPDVGLGSALAWAGRHQVDEVVVIVDGPAAPLAPDLARQAELFRAPPRVLGVAGRALVPVVAGPAPVPSPASAEAMALTDPIAAAGLEVVVEHGVVSGEVHGLEVARVIDEPGSEPRIEVGVGRHDREAFTMLHGDLPPAEALRAVADAVHKHRRPGAPSHPLNRLAAERWLRAHLIGDDDRLPRWQLRPVPGLVARTSVQDQLPAFAVGHDDEGRPVVLACSVGIDLDLVPQAADLREAIAPEAELVLALPARDVHPVTTRLADALRRPAEVLPIEGDWRR